MSKLMVLLRGCAGAGKSTFASHIWVHQVICEADQFFYDEHGEYKFNGALLKEAHKWCRDKVEGMMKENETSNGVYYPEIVVSNTFTQEWEMKEYFDLAEKYGYMVVSLIVENRHGGKNIHGVPEEKVEAMRKRFEIKL